MPLFFPTSVTVLLSWSSHTYLAPCHKHLADRYAFVMQTTWKRGLSLLLQSMHGFLVFLAKIPATPSGRTGGSQLSHHFRQNLSLLAGMKQLGTLLTIFKGYLAC